MQEGAVPRVEFLFPLGLQGARAAARAAVRAGEATGVGSVVAATAVAVRAVAASGSTAARVPLLVF